MKKIVFLFTLSLMLTACSVEKKNDEMHQFVASQEHDERLFGWWQLVNQPTNYLYYDNVTFNVGRASEGEDGSITRYDSYWYWYTYDMNIYEIRDATPLTGLISSHVEYRISEDGEYLMHREGDGVFVNALKRVSYDLPTVN